MLSTPRPALLSLLLLMVCFAFSLRAQNLVPNHSFEVVAPCPTLGSLLCENVAIPWKCPNDGSTDLFHACGGPWPGNQQSVPHNSQGYQQAQDGNGYAGFFCHWGTNGREYAQAQLIQPLVAGQWYNAWFYVARSESFCAIEHIGLYFSSTVMHQPGFDYFDYEPQVESDFGFIYDTMDWVIISGCFQAEGGEQYITVGNFRNDTESPLDPSCQGNLAYYYFDDIHIEEGSPPGDISFDLGDDVEACFDYEIDPDHPGPYFHWSNGTSGPTLTVDTTGTYVLTITDGCAEAVDSIHVTIAGNQPEVDLGPPSVVICEGASYSIMLNPSLQEYEWQDGSNASTYIITDPGVYSVTLDDGCAASSDEITIESLAPPQPFTLGIDIELCPGDEAELMVDASQGNIFWQDGSTNATYTIASGGTYSVTIINICGAESDQIMVTEIDVPVFDIGAPDIELCTGNNLVIQIDPALGDIEWEDGSTDAEYTILTAGNYTVTVSNACGEATDEVDVTERETPFVDLGPDLTPCAGDVIVLQPDVIDGEYDWQDHSNATEYVVTTSGAYALTISNDCGYAIDTVNVQYNPILTAPSFGPDVILCPGESLVLHANNPGATILWQDQSSADSLLVTSSGTYWVQASNACSLVTDTIVVNFNSNPPDIDLPTQLSLCNGASTTINAGITGVTYLWSDQSQLQELVVTAPGQYSLTVTNACGTDIDTVDVIDGGLAPVVDLGVDLDLCPGEQITITPTNANVTNWLWQDGSTNPTYTVSAADTIIVSVNNSCGTANDTLEVSMLPPVPTVALGMDTALCAQQTYTLSVNIPDVSVTWQDGTTDTNYTVTSPGLVYVTIANACGMSSDTIQVNALPPVPPLDLGIDQSLCPGELIVLSPGIDDVAYMWQDGSTDTFYQSTQADTIILTISNACGVSTDTVEIVESTQGPVVNLGPDIEVCEGEMVTLMSDISGVDYEWQDGSTSSQFVTAQSGTFILEVSNNCGADIDTVVVDIHGIAPVIALGPDTLLCDDAALTLHAGTDAETDVEWQDGSASESFILTDAGVYHVTATNKCGEATDTIVVSALASPEPFSLGQDTGLCPLERIVLHVPNNEHAWQWQDGSTSDSLVIVSAGMYALTVSNACGQATDAIVVSTLQSPPPFSLGPDTLLCPEETILLQVPDIDYAWQWHDGYDSPIRIVDAAGVYGLVISNSCGVESDSIVVSIDDRIPVIAIDPSILWCVDDTITLDATQAFAAGYLWSTGATSSTIVVHEPGSFHVDVTVPCMTRGADMEIVPDPDCFIQSGIYIPNVFSPNGDGINDVFSIHPGSTITMISMEGTIYDRWGNVVFASSAIPFTWDGRFGGENVMPGVYVYRVTCKYEVVGNIYEEVFTGDVTVIR